MTGSWSETVATINCILLDVSEWNQRHSNSIFFIRYTTSTWASSDQYESSDMNVDDQTVDWQRHHQPPRHGWPQDPVKFSIQANRTYYLVVVSHKKAACQQFFSVLFQ